MGIADRIEGSIEKWRTKWGDMLKAWLIAVVSFGLEVFMDILGKAFAPKLQPLIDTIEATGKVPPELQPILDEMKNPTGEIAGIFSGAAGYALVGGAVGKLLDAILLPIAYAVNTATKNVIIAEPQILASWLRKDMTEEQTDEFLTWLGHAPEDIDWLKKLATIRFDPATITALYRRDKVAYEKFWADLEHQGWTPDRIEAAKELVKVIPPLSDMVRFADYSAFDPTVIEKWREFYDAPGWIKEPMSKVGIVEDWANKYWFSHWRQPGRFELGEMHRRELIDDDTVKLAYLTMGYSSFWQDALLQLVRQPWTRVDVRRMWDMRTISEDELRKAYHMLGYYDEQLEGMILWTKVYVAFPDLIARFKNGWITEDDVRSELAALGMPSERVEEMIQTKIKTAAPERIEPERTATATEIMKAVKKEYITWAEGVERLGRMGYSPEEADFKIRVYVGVAEGSPETYVEFLDWTERYRKTQGLDAYIPSAELIEAAKAYKADPSTDNTYRYRQLLIAYEEEVKKLKSAAK